MDCRHASRSRTKPLVARLAGALLSLCLAPCVAGAVEFPVTGTISVNGNPGALPSGGHFGDSTYDAATGDLSAGKFTFPQATTTFHSDALNVDVTVNYQLSQTNSATGQVAMDGVAALSTVQMKLQIVSAFAAGVVPIPVGTCIFQPIDLELAGTGAAGGLDLSDDSFTIPQVGPNDCGGNGDEINSGIAGSNNSMQIQMAGDFTPPSANDTIFIDGFDASNR
ncbi:MAG: hypothetical protein ABIR62_01780 [Dokdonella sp.]|uniref:hypothetical protein n=1 Tax=Dokdonella sp. TaxID=2291710 RepID=UPI003265EC3B